MSQGNQLPKYEKIILDRKWELIIGELLANPSVFNCLKLIHKLSFRYDFYTGGFRFGR